MGVAVSKSEVETEVSNIFKSSLYNECPTVKVSQVQEVGDITIENCDAKALFSQEVFYDDDCAMQTLVESLTDYSLRNEQKISQGMLPNLVNVSKFETRESVRSEVAREVANICGNVDVNQHQIIGNVFCKGGSLNLPVLQKFQGRSSCVANEVLRRADNFDLKQNQDVEQSSGVGAFFKKWLNLWGIIAIGTVILFLLVAYYFSSDPQSRKAVVGAAVAAVNPIAGFAQAME